MFDFDDESPVMSLTDFLKLCVVTVTGTSVFQNFPKPNINVFKIPPLLSKALCSEIRNRESCKKSVFLKSVDFKQVDFNEVTKLVTSGDFDVLKSRRLDLKSLRNLGAKINIPRARSQTKVMLGRAPKMINLTLFVQLGLS